MLIPIELPEANSRILNLQRATTDYVAEYNVCKCRPCHNGGTLTLLDGKCICMCPELFEGLGCQNFKGDKARVPRKRRHSPCPDRCLCVCYLCLNCTITALQLQDLLSFRRVTGRAGQAGPAVRGRSAAGHAAATQWESSGPSAGATQKVKNTAEQLHFWFLLFQNVSDIKDTQPSSAGKACEEQSHLLVCNGYYNLENIHQSCSKSKLFPFYFSQFLIFILK